MTPTSSPRHHLFSSLVAALIVTRLLSGSIVIFSETSCCTKGFQENVFYENSR
ncbi:hypothetical protein DAI22_09g006168 [Oryza sativa Japonica Group]|nr:hypothetical protein DAI22_09g006168 [Oryza sativa Japonica Group]